MKKYYTIDILEMLKKISKFNKTKWNIDKASSQILESSVSDECEKQENKTIGSLFTNKNLRFKTLFLIIKW